MLHWLMPINDPMTEKAATARTNGGLTEVENHVCGLYSGSDVRFRMVRSGAISGAKLVYYQTAI